MNKPSYVFQRLSSLVSVFLLFASAARSQSTLDCKLCHSSQVSLWQTGRHANTQTDIANELAVNWKGQTPDSVISGSQAENCVACHSPSSVSVLGGMTETQVMSQFFTTTNGTYTDSTKSADTTNWPHVACVGCHNVPSNHPATMPVSAAFNSTSKQYDSVATASQLCGRCHGTLRFADTDHRVYDAWKTSHHGHRNQTDIAGELAASWAGQPPDSLINGSQAENCIACHAPTSTDPRHGVTEVQVVSRFFTLKNGVFDSTTTVADTSHWPDLGCSACHNPHKPDALAFFNSTTGTYQSVANSNELCGQCHGTLRFPETDHGSYDISAGTGGVGVADHVTMPGATCTDCHMHRSDVDGSNSKNFSGHTWSVFAQENDGSVTTACTKCHATMVADSALACLDRWQHEFASLDSTAGVLVARAESTLANSTDSLKLRYLAEARHNLAYAEMDESGGFHNHHYTIALLNDAITKVTSTTGVKEEFQSIVPERFQLHQNYPNPFNPSTAIQYDIAKESFVELKIFDLTGREVRTLVQKVQVPGKYMVSFSADVLPSGVYFYQLRAGTYLEVRKMLLLK